MTVPTVDLSTIDPRSEVILRGGNVAVPGARLALQRAYLRADPAYGNLLGISVLFRAGATIDELAREGMFPHPKISIAVVTDILRELNQVSLGLSLYITPTQDLPDHHTLCVTQGGVSQDSLSDVAGAALIRAMRVIDNTYQRKEP
jgi:hypothetical protein